MEIYMLYFGVSVLISNYISLTTSTPLFNLTTDQHSLTVLKNSIVSDSYTILHKNWSIHTPICGWIGVSCGSKHQRVTSLNLSTFGLRGTIPPHLGNLTFLRVLDISSNIFSGVLPSELSKLRRLEEINVAANNFTGEIPSWFGALSQLRHMDLSDNVLSGRIPSSLFNISRLQNLNLSFNILDGNIPEEIVGLSFLESVSLGSNELEGSIPYIVFNISSLMSVNLGFNMLSGKLPNNICSNTPRLREFTVYRNQLDGEIPRNISKCKELELLQLQLNKFSGQIPSEIGSLSMLKDLHIWRNKLKGRIPKQVGNLTSLEVLNFEINQLTGELPGNSLSGSIPHGLFNITTLQLLDLSWNNFSSTLPSNIGLSLPNLQNLHLHSNKLSGPIPASINNASQLEELFLLDNSFTGFIPSFPSLRLLTSFLLSINSLSATREMEFLSSLTNSEHLEVVEISGNPLLGCALPNSIGNLSQSLEIFLVHDAGIRGVIPSEIGNLASLIDIELHNNQLSGSIPATMGNLKKLGRLSLYENQLQGSIPLEFCEMSSLVELYMSNNEFKGPIPECLGGMQSLRMVSFESNKLNSTLPSNLWNLKDLVFLNLSSNYLSGQISPQVGNLKVINGIDLSFNLFSGDIPSSIGRCPSVDYLILSNNNFGGSIPQSLANMKGLTTLDLSNNNFTGMIPKSLQDLKFLEYFNVSYNRLEGEIPNGSCFSNFTALSFVHNSALCGPARFEVPPCPEVDGGSKSKSVARLMKYILPPLVSAMAIVIIVVIHIRRWKLVKVRTQVSTSLGNPWRIISYIELSRATDSFSETNLLGRGSFGSVFRGLFDDGLNFAVKVFNIELEGGNKSFETESRILSTIRHRNLVRIIGCCTNMEFKALILEIMPNGSVEKWLYSNGYCGDILQLLNIAIDVALALEYLHHGNTFPIVHCDIKPSNVLLDEDMTARVADFGIAKLFEEGEAMVHTKTLATIGYAAPEYGSEGKVSTGADVYSFGIMLLEMFTRKKPTDDMFDGEKSLKEWVSEALLANEIIQVLAPALLPVRDRHFDMKMSEITSVFELAMKCLGISPDERINMIEAEATLKRIKAKFVIRVTTRPQQHTITIT
ncbi:probable LRR receptor-like serine/threonine-protein kinase At3g47570 [Salvia splendens]|uniref:probable LRR receptor-like serine/threonine-protein kinase At3g47570 n=1 Tax=Salvia splendens TaxID=180675 RepID=UPI001C254E09|nr:probable LRR receptor-like serine/threonine-protein kinase At3g47570 [Salvia splendens]